MTTDTRHRLTAGAVAVAVHLLLLALLLGVYLRYDNTDTPRQWPPADSSELLLGGEYVLVGDTPEPTLSAQPAAQQPAPSQTEPEMAPEPLLTQTTPSPAQSAPAPKPETKPKAEARPSAEDARRAETSKAISNRVKFGQSDAGQQGSPDGNATEGAVSGIVAEGFGNRKAVSLPKPAKGPMGTVVVAIKVNAEGRVTYARVSGGTGAAASSDANRRRCEAAARNARFSPSEVTSQSGTLTYRFR